jgi:hypothetical protein
MEGVVVEWIDLAQNMDQLISFEEDNEPSGYRKYWEFLQWLSNFWLFTRNFDSIVLWSD